MPTPIDTAMLALIILALLIALGLIVNLVVNNVNTHRYQLRQFGPPQPFWVKAARERRR